MSVDRGMDKEDVVYIHSGILPSHKKDKLMPFVVTWGDLEIVLLSEISQRKTNITLYDIYTMEYYSAIKRNEVLARATGCTWKTLC